MLYIIMMTNVLAPSITWFLQVRSGQDSLVRYGMVGMAGVVGVLREVNCIIGHCNLKGA